MGLDSLPPLRDIIRDHDLRAEKKFGQNFLLDQNLTDKIARFADVPADCPIVEIGPGPGGLTRSLLRQSVSTVTVIEFDPRAIIALNSLQEASDGRLQIIEGDALSIDVAQIYERPCAIVANLPYNIATPLLVGWLSLMRPHPETIHSMTLMFQKEVAQRICAKVGEKHYGRLAVLTQWLCDVRYGFDIPPQAFTPPPKVTSAVVRFTPKTLQKDAPAFEAVEKVTAAAFGQRRKMIRSSLASYQPYFEVVGLDETQRAETVTPAQFIELAKFKDVS